MFLGISPPLLALLLLSVGCFFLGLRIQPSGDTWYQPRDRAIVFARGLFFYGALILVYVAGVGGILVAGASINWDFGGDTNWIGLSVGILIACVGYGICDGVRYETMMRDGYISGFFDFLKWLPVGFGIAVIGVGIKTYFSYETEVVSTQLPTENILLVLQEVRISDCGNGKTHRTCAGTFYRIQTDRGEYFLPARATVLGNACELRSSSSHTVLKRKTTGEVVKSYDDTSISRMFIISRGCLN